MFENTLDSFFPEGSVRVLAPTSVLPSRGQIAVDRDWSRRPSPNRGSTRRPSSSLVLASSTPQLAYAPFSVTSMKTNTWGLFHSTLLTTPLRVTGFFSSNSAAQEWCAIKGATARAAPKARVNTGVAQRNIRNFI